LNLNISSYKQLLIQSSILNQPFDFSQAFDRALKNIVNTLGNRPAHEIAEDTVSFPMSP